MFQRLVSVTNRLISKSEDMPSLVLSNIFGEMYNVMLFVGDVAASDEDYNDAIESIDNIENMLEWN